MGPGRPDVPLPVPLRRCVPRYCFGSPEPGWPADRPYLPTCLTPSSPDRFEITKLMLRDGEDIATCPSCSLIVRVIYDPVRLVPGNSAAAAGRPSTFAAADPHRRPISIARLGGLLGLGGRGRRRGLRSRERRRVGQQLGLVPLGQGGGGRRRDRQGARGTRAQGLEPSFSVLGLLRSAAYEGRSLEPFSTAYVVLQARPRCAARGHPLTLRSRPQACLHAILEQ